MSQQIKRRYGLYERLHDATPESVSPAGEVGGLVNGRQRRARWR